MASKARWALPSEKVVSGHSLPSGILLQGVNVHFLVNRVDGDLGRIQDLGAVTL
jgi:hypothetical protein